MALAITFALLTLLLASAAFLPFLPFAHGIARIGDFPRQQFCALALALLAASLFVSDGGGVWLSIQLGLGAIAAVNLAHVLPYTPLWRKETADFDGARDRKGHELDLIACNVKMSNRHYERLSALIEERDPDIFVLMEVDQPWADAFADVLRHYPHTVLQPQENSYGLIMASKFPLIDPQVQFLLTEGVPSIITTVELPDGQHFRLYCIHPEPPVPHRETTGRDGETSLIALRTREETMPVIVTGDLNDVAWSMTTRRFRRISRLLDPRIGRKVFSTFDARYPLIRWPLDHLFHSAEFRLMEMKRLPPCGSDHFPVEFKLFLCPNERSEDEPEKADKADFERARELVADARKRDDDPIGTDWEK